MSCYGCKYNTKTVTEFRNWCEEPTFKHGVIVATKGDCDRFESALIASLGSDIETINKKKIITIGSPFKKRKHTKKKADPVKQAKANAYLLKCIQNMRRRKREQR